MGKLNRLLLPEQPTRPKLNRLHRLKDNKGTSYWDLIVSTGETCFVCDKDFSKGYKPIFIGKHKKYPEEELKRHDYCCPGSSNWYKKFGGYIGGSMPKKYPNKG